MSLARYLFMFIDLVAFVGYGVLWKYLFTTTIAQSQGVIYIYQPSMEHYILHRK